MALEKRYFAKIAGAGKGQQVFAYKSETDNAAACLGSGYFNSVDLAGQVGEGDLLYINATNAVAVTYIDSANTTTGAIALKTLVAAVAKS